VSANNGEFRHETLDISLPSPRLPIVFKRTIGGQDLYDGPFGRGWDFNYNQRLVPLEPNVFPAGSKMPLVVRAQPDDSAVAADRDVLFHDGSGRVVHFVFAGNTAPSEVVQDPLVTELGWLSTASAFYLPEKGVFDVLVRFPSGEFARLTPDGMQFWYTKRGRLERIYHRYPENRHGLIYNERDELIRIVDESVDADRFLDLGYYRLASDPLFTPNLDEQTDNVFLAGKIARLLDYAGRDVLFFYTDDGLLERREGFEVAGANGGFSGRAITTYVWSDEGDIQGVVAGGGSQGGPLFSGTLGGTEEQRSIQQGQVPGGSVSVAPPGQNTAAASEGSTTSVTGPDGAQATFTFDKLGNPKEIKFGAGATYTPVYNDLGLLESITFPEGNTITYTYDVGSPNLRARANVIAVEKDPGTRGGPMLTAAFAYDERYNLLSGASTDFGGNPITYSVTSDGRDVEEIRFGAAGTMSVDYDDHGQVESITTPDGLRVELDYDAASGFKTAERNGGIETGFGYDSSVAGLLGMPASITLPRGAAIGNQYDERLQLTQMTRGGLTEKRAYDENGNVVKIDRTVGSGASRVEERRYDQINFLEEVKLLGVEVDGAPADLTTKFTPDAAGRVHEVTYPGGETKTLEYDDRGHLTKMTLGQYVEEYTRDRHGNLLELKQGGDVTRTYVYDGHDRLIELHKKLDTGEEVTTFSYFGAGELASLLVTDPMFGQVLGIEVMSTDEFGRPKNITYHGDTASSFANHSYSVGSGGTITVQGPRDSTTTTYDAAGRVVSVSNSLRAVTFDLDDNGNVEAIDSAEDGTTYHTRFEYDDLDWAKKQSDDVGLIASITPRIDGSPVSITDGLSHTTAQGFTVLGELASIDRPNGVQFEFQYSSQRDGSAVQDGTGAGHDYDYDDTFRMTSATLRNGTQIGYGSFDGRNRPTQITIPGGSITAAYDRQGRLKSQNVSFGGGPGFQSAYTYDALSRVREATYGESGGNTATYTYDQLGPLLEAKYEEDGSTFTVGYDLDQDGTRKKVSYPSVDVDEAREGNGRLTGVSPANGPRIEVIAFAGAEIPSEVILGGIVRETNTYDLRKRLLATRYEAIGSGALLADMRFQYDAANNLIARQFVHRSGRTDLFGYDAGKRLTEAEVGGRPAVAGESPASGFNSPVPGFVSGLYGRSYGYDSSGLDLLETITTTSRLGPSPPPFATSISGHDGFLHPGTVDGFSRGTPDPLGNTLRTMLQVRDQNAAEPRPVEATLTYDGLAQLRTIERDDGVTIEYQYQHTGLVHRRSVRQDGAAVADEAFVYDAGRLIEIYDLLSGSGIPSARFYYADGDAPVVAELVGPSGSLEPFHYLRDTAGSVVAVADAGANVVERVIYDPWGQPVIESRDSAAPEVARITSTQGGFFVQFTEIVLPPLASTGAGPDLVTNYANVAGAFTVANGSTVPGTIRYEEHPSFGPGLRFEPSAALAGNLTLTLQAGSLTDEWGNGNPAQTVSFVYSPIEGTVLLQAQPLGSTAPQRSARSTVGSPFLFQGQYFDYDAGLLYLRARFYDPFTGHFLQRDPNEYEDSVNLYAGFAQNPVTLRDPSGRGAGTRIARALARKGADEAAEQALRRAAELGRLRPALGPRLDGAAVFYNPKRVRPVEAETFSVTSAIRGRSGPDAKVGQHVDDVVPDARPPSAARGVTDEPVAPGPTRPKDAGEAGTPARSEARRTVSDFSAEERGTVFRNGAQKIEAELEQILRKGEGVDLYDAERELFRQGGQINVEGVTFGSVRVSLVGDTLVAQRLAIKNNSGIGGMGSLMTQAFEQATRNLGRRLGVSKASVRIDLFTNDSWRQVLEARGYQKQMIRKADGIGAEFPWVRDFNLE
jgi:RHS repeat-associated protein